MNCSKCGSNIPESMKFCNECGTPVSKACPNCSFENPAQSKFCGECGSPLGAQPATSAPNQEKEAERRQLTVMFCDLVGSTQLSEQLDPEDLREVMRSYQELCEKEISRFGGHIAKYLGDGLLVYFGYPEAHEDDAQRSVRTGLAILRAIRELPQQDKMKTQALQVRIGIHTGLVVAGEMGAGEVREKMAIVGETPNIAARLEGLAATNTVVISRDTYKLIEGYFECESIGKHTLKGISRPMEVYEVLSESALRSRIEVASTKGLSSLVGRDKEVEALFGTWYKAKEGRGQLALLSGEAGIGKSRLVEALKSHLAGEPHQIINARCLPYFQNSFLYPVIDCLERQLAISKDDSPEEKFNKLKSAFTEARLRGPLEETIPLFASLLSIPVNGNFRPPGLPPQIQKQKTQKALIDWLKSEIEKSPVLFILEDLHWVDPSTLEFLNLFIENIRESRVLIILTFRPDFTLPWESSQNLTEISLSRLSKTDIQTMAQSVAGGKTLPPELIEQLVAKTDGVPLFVEELTKMVLESDFMKEQNGNYELTRPIPSLAIPSTIQDSLMARLDRLAPVREVVQLAATLGREFTYDLLFEISYVDGGKLNESLSQLVDTEILYQHGSPPGAAYVFKHALIRDAAYESLLKSRRRQYHERAAQAYESLYINDLSAYYPILAHHWSMAAGEQRDHKVALLKTIEYLELSGETALRSGAFKESYQFLKNAIDLYDSLPDEEKNIEQELKLLKNLGTASFATTGYGSEQTKEIYDRALILCDEIGDKPEVFPVLWGTWLSYHFSSNTDKQIEFGERLLQIAQKEGDEELLLQAHHALWTILILLPDYKESQKHLEAGRKLYKAEMQENHCFHYGGHDPGMCCYRALCLSGWTMGYPDRAIEWGHEGIRLAQSHNFSLITAHMAAAFTHKQRGDIEGTQEQADLIIQHANENGLPGPVLWASIFKGWILGQTGECEKGVSVISEAMEKLGYKDPGYMSMLVELYILADKPKEGLKLADELLEIAETKNEYNYVPELLRLRSELLLLQARAGREAGRIEKQDAEAIEKGFLDSLAMAEKQGAMSLKLRTATSLARFLKDIGRAEEGRDVLNGVYGWFSEGLDTADLKLARKTLDELS